MEQLTHQNRVDILRNLDRFSNQIDTNDSSLVQHVSKILENNPPVNDYEKAFHKYSLDLLNYIRKNKNESIEPVARGALAFAFSDHSSLVNVEKLMALHIKTFIVSLAVSELRESDKILQADELKALDTSEKKLAEELLLEYAETPLADDEELIDYTVNFIKTHEGNHSTSLSMRFYNNLLYLINIIRGKTITSEHKSWARGAISYLIKSDDIISDELGVIGFLDDMYIAQTAVQLISPQRSALDELVSGLFHYWTFLTDLIFDYKGISHSLNDFNIINIAHMCPDLNNQENTNKTALILTDNGLTPFLISICTVFGLVYRSINDTTHMLDLIPGKKVLVDNKSIAVYQGITTIDKKEYIKLSQFKQKKITHNKKEEFETSFFISVDESSRIVPAEEDKKARGSITTHIDNTGIPLSVMERIFHLDYPLHYQTNVPRVWLIAPVANSKFLSSKLSIYGNEIKDAFPMGHIKRDGELEPWSAKFGSCIPLLTFISDIDLAVEILEETQLGRQDVIIIDLSGANRNRAASLSYFKNINTNVLCVAEEKESSVLEQLESLDFNFFEWTSKEAGNLLQYSKADILETEHPICVDNNNKYRSYTHTSTEVIIDLDMGERAYESWSTISEYEKINREDLPTDFEQALDYLTSLFFSLIRLSISYEHAPLLLEKTLKIVENVKIISEKSNYLSKDERLLLDECISNCELLNDSLLNENRKSAAINEITKEKPDARILLPNEFKHWQIDRMELDNGSNHLFFSDIKDDVYTDLIIPFWPGKERIWKIISKPPAHKMHYILYNFESVWQKSFEKNKIKQRLIRSNKSDRTIIFPSIKTWRKNKDGNKPIEIIGDGIRDIIEIRNERRRAKILRNIDDSSELTYVDSILVEFSGNIHAFLSTNYEAQSVTHVLTDYIASEEDNINIKYIKPNDLSVGEVLVFMKGTDRDAIRELADKNMPYGTRDLAKIWQVALKNYVDENELTAFELRQKLKENGCTKHIATIRYWLQSELIIAPRDAHTGDIDAICEVTNDAKLKGKLNDCKKAITLVWGEHLKAGTTIAKQVFAQIGNRLTGQLNLDEPLDIGEGLILARVENVDTQIISIPQNCVNKLLET
jgi:uncharacterized membrane protein YkvA (DUF1232 family)